MHHLTHPVHRRLAGAALAVALTAGLVACGSSGSDDASSSSPTTTAAKPAKTTTTTAASSGSTTTVDPRATTTTAAGGAGADITTANICSLVTLDQVATILPNPKKGVIYPPSVIKEGARCDWEQEGTKAFANVEADRPGAALAKAVVQGQIASGLFATYPGVGDIAGSFLTPAKDGGAVIAAKGDVVVMVVVTHVPAPQDLAPLANLATELLDQLAS